MAKYVEIPRKPREVEAVQFLSVTNGVPKISEATVPDWFLAAFVQKTLQLVGEDVFLREEPLVAGDFLIYEAAIGSLSKYPEGHFAANFRRKRKVPVQRKPRAKKLEIAA